ncbi:MAG: 4Fe-4S binding protein [Phycisphaerales bacterium]|nr:4Fe-4S binding protein [Phycisphaerales bacterium]
MNYLSPIFTEHRECQDCYKCLRHCPVKAIKIEAGCATVLPDLCVFCGQCVEVCPSHAKRVRDDLGRARQLLASGKRVFVSLAPSYLAEFPSVKPAQMIRALKQLGFAEISETALGAQQVSAHVRAVLGEPSPRVLLSSACPSIVAYLQKHRPELTPAVTELLSPLLTHCTMLRRTFGEEIAIVFIGPCIAKKLEGDAHPELLDVVLTFDDLHRWLDQDNIIPAQLVPQAGDAFVPEAAGEGVLYPVDGGMIAGIKGNCAVADAAFMTFSGLPVIQRALDGLETLKPDRSLFIELLACEGGCINGPRICRKAQTIRKRFEILKQPNLSAMPEARVPAFPIPATFPNVAQQILEPTDAQLREALHSVGKISLDDELNCGGCGYDSCRQFGRALLAHKAERSMCVTYMRKLAHKKANALIQKMPSAVVIVDETLKILEHNAAFLRLFRRDQTEAFEGTPLATLVPFHPLFAAVLKSGEDMLEKDLRYRETILHLSVFTIEKHCVVGAIIQDITKPAVQREQVISRAQEVIQKNLATVQQIAYLLGENAAESEVTLNSIIDSFSPPKLDELTPPPNDGDWRKLYRK